MLDPAEALILEYFHPDASARILILEGGDGSLAAELVPKVPTGEIITLGRDFRQVETARLRLTKALNVQVSAEVFPSSGGWDFVVLLIPKERRYARTLLLAAWQALKPGGKLLLAGPGKGGAKAVITDAERLFGNISVLGYRNHQRLAASIRGEALPDPLPPEFHQPGVAPGSRHIVEVHRPEGALRLETHPGIFSWEALDEGTALLLEHLRVEHGARVWDVGCGYGGIGLSAALAGAGFVIMSDVNLLAVQYAQKNAKSIGFENRVQVFPADGLNFARLSPLDALRFDLIVSNPAFHQGRQVDHSMPAALIAQASNFLAPEGRLFLVANRFLNYDKSMREIFRHVTRIAETNKFHVIEAKQK
ncbi:MAG: methyltransferase [Anaerolineales bacterium]